MNYLIKAFIVIAVLSLTVLTSCSEPTAPKAVITVLSRLELNQKPINSPVENAIVTVFIDPNTGKQGYVDPDGNTEKMVKSTNSSGQCEFEFVVENILNVRAEFAVGKDTLYGTGAIKLQEDETYHETISLSKWKQSGL